MRVRYWEREKGGGFTGLVEENRRIVALMLEAGVHMHSTPTQLPNDRSHFPSLTRFGQELADGAPNAEVVFLSEEMKALTALAINQDQCRGAFHFVGAHREWTTASTVGSVDTNREGQPIFMNENCQRLRRHDIVVFKYRVQTDHSDIVSIELPLNTLHLRNAMMHAAGTQHLKGMHAARRPCRAARQDRVDMRC